MSVMPFVLKGLALLAAAAAGAGEDERCREIRLNLEKADLILPLVFNQLAPGEGEEHWAVSFTRHALPDGVVGNR